MKQQLVIAFHAGQTSIVTPRTGIGPNKVVNPPDEIWPICPTTGCHHQTLSSQDPYYDILKDEFGDNGLVFENCLRNKCYRATDVINPCLHGMHTTCGNPQTCLCPCHYP